jgi:hypothetical protein
VKSAKVFTILTFGIFGSIFFHLARQMLQIRPDGWYVGQVNLYGDLVLHLAFINKFIEGGKILIESPIYAGSKPNYPVFADLITAQLAKITGIDLSLLLTTFFTGLLVIFIARLFIRNFINNEKIVFLALLIFFLNGGLGFHYFFQDYINSSTDLVTFLLNMPNEYTDIKENGYWWINNYLAYFLPQRGFLFAFPVTLTVLILLYRGIKKKNTLYFLLAGTMAGVMPIIQAHSLFVLFILAAAYSTATIVSAKDKKQTVFNWIIFALITAMLAIPLFKAISSSENVLKYIRLDPGFTSEENIIWFWIKNLGLFAPMFVVSVFWIFRKNRQAFLLYCPFLFLFIISNIFIFQPWAFDNTKILIYWFFASSILVAYFLYEEFFTESWFKKILGILAVFIMILAGTIDLFRTFTPPTNYRIFSNIDIEVANSVKNFTPKDSLFVTASNHNHPIPSLSGRSTLLGFHGWIWSHGLTYQQRAQDIEKIYTGGDTASRLIKNYRINYVTVGPQEKADFDVNESYFSQFPKIYLARGWEIYDVGDIWSDGNR